MFLDDNISKKHPLCTFKLLICKLTLHETTRSLNVSPQMTLTADELIVHKICAIYDIETIPGRFGTSQGPNLPSIASISSFAQILWKITSSAVKVVWIDINGTVHVDFNFCYSFTDF